MLWDRQNLYYMRQMMTQIVLLIYKLQFFSTYEYYIGNIFTICKVSNNFINTIKLMGIKSMKIYDKWLFIVYLTEIKK